MGEQMSKEDRREIVKATCDDVAVKLLFYDRKDDSDLGVGVIEEMILNEEVTVEEILAWICGPIHTSLTKKSKT